MSLCISQVSSHFHNLCSKKRRKGNEWILVLPAANVDRPQCFLHHEDRAELMFWGFGGWVLNQW